MANTCPDRKTEGVQSSVAIEGDSVESAASASSFSLDFGNSSLTDLLEWNTDTGATSHMTVKVTQSTN